MRVEMNLAAFKAELEREKRVLPEQVAQGTRYLGLAIYRNIVKATPVDTGRARGSWTIQYTSPDTSVLPEAPSKSKNHYAPPSPKLGGPPDPFSILWLNNELEYIGPLNNGWSAQAPKRFVEIAIDQALATANPLGFVRR